MAETVSPRLAPGPPVPWTATLDESFNAALVLMNDGTRWEADPFNPLMWESPRQPYIDAVRDRSAGFILAADGATPTRDVFEMLEVLQGADITVGEFNVEVRFEAPEMPDPAWVATLADRLSNPDTYWTEHIAIIHEQVTEWEAYCPIARQAFEFDASTLDGPTLAKSLADGHKACGCSTSAERWAALAYLMMYEYPPPETTDGSYPIELTSAGITIEFAWTESWGETAKRLPPPTGERIQLQLRPKDPPPASTQKRPATARPD